MARSLSSRAEGSYVDKRTDSGKRGGHAKRMQPLLDEGRKTRDYRTKFIRNKRAGWGESERELEPLVRPVVIEHAAFQDVAAKNAVGWLVETKVRGAKHQDAGQGRPIHSRHQGKTHVENLGHLRFPSRRESGANAGLENARYVQPRKNLIRQAGGIAARVDYEPQGDGRRDRMPHLPQHILASG